MMRHLYRLCGFWMKSHDIYSLVYVFCGFVGRASILQATLKDCANGLNVSLCPVSSVSSGEVVFVGYHLYSSHVLITMFCDLW